MLCPFFKLENMLYRYAAQLAVNTCNELQQFCEVINIAGSLRRGLSEISDIDLICVPRYTEVVALELFGSAVPTKRVSVNFVDTIKKIGTITNGSPEGRYMSLNVKGNKVDIFMPNPVDFYRQLCIRTGSADYVHYNIASTWSKKGWCGTDQGLRMIKDCREKISVAATRNSIKWEVINPDATLPPAWESEEHFYDWLGVTWIHPRQRRV